MLFFLAPPHLTVVASILQHFVPCLMVVSYVERVFCGDQMGTGFFWHLVETMMFCFFFPQYIFTLPPNEKAKNTVPV